MPALFQFLTLLAFKIFIFERVSHLAFVVLFSIDTEIWIVASQLTLFFFSSELAFILFVHEAVS